MWAELCRQSITQRSSLTPDDAFILISHKDAVVNRVLYVHMRILCCLFNANFTSSQFFEVEYYMHSSYTTAITFAFTFSAGNIQSPGSDVEYRWISAVQLLVVLCVCVCVCVCLSLCW